MHRGLETKLCSVAGVEDIMLAQMPLANGALRVGDNARVIRGVLGGTCGGNVIPTTEQLRELMN